MNNLLPTLIRMHEKYDLKGSTYKRKASKNERSKKSPTLKDLDFREKHLDGLMLEADTYTALVKTLERDCRVSCCCLPTPMTLASGGGGSPIFPLVVH